MTILLTGASGFLGRALLKYFKNSEIIVRPVFRNLESARRIGWDENEISFFSSLSPSTNWIQALDGVKTVVHCAARVHVVEEDKSDRSILYRTVNVDSTLNLARQAAAAGVQRFVFISSIVVNGDKTFGVPFTANDVPNPQGPYAQSKWEAEQALKQLAAEEGMELVVIRPPLIYGPGAPGSFGRLVSAVRREKWLPLGSVNNSRTLVGLENLVSLIATCIDHPKAAGEVFLAGDSEDTSTADLVMRLAAFMGTRVNIFSVPVRIMILGAALIGKSEMIKKICSDLQVDISKNSELLGWQPPLDLDAGLRYAVQEKC